MNVIPQTLKETLMVTTFVFVMMVWVDYFNVLTRGRLAGLLKGRGGGRQYFVSALVGDIPGCLGGFMNVSLYEHGLISFGALTGSMMAGHGDEAFVMFALFPRQTLVLTGILFVIGVVGGWLTDCFGPWLKLRRTVACPLSTVHDHEACFAFNLAQIKRPLTNLSWARGTLGLLLAGSLFAVASGIIGPPEWNWKRITFVMLISSALFIVMTAPEHYLHEHIWQHIAKRHLWRVALWTLGALAVVEFGLHHWDLKTLVREHMLYVLLIAGLVGVIPESGPHMVFVMMFAQGVIPFSVLLTSSIVQDGHSALPLLSYSVRDTALMKLISLAFGLGCGGVAYSLGW
jgi:hypothetical protein